MDNLILTVGQGGLRQLLKEGIKCSYVLINAVSYIMKEVGLETDV